jgi:hypothetical protein
LISDLLARVPDRKVPSEPIVFPPLPAPPLREKFRGPLKPIASA